MAIAGSLRITSALTLIDEAAKEELREGKNGAPVRGGALVEGDCGVSVIAFRDHLVVCLPICSHPLPCPSPSAPLKGGPRCSGPVLQPGGSCQH